MRFLVIVKATAQSEAGVLPSREMVEKMTVFNEQLAAAGALLAAEGLQPTSKGARIKYSAGKGSVTDGPFTETKELVAGFWILQMKSKEDVVEWLLRCPFDDEAIEIRQIYEPEDFAPIFADAGQPK